MIKGARSTTTARPRSATPRRASTGQAEVIAQPPRPSPASRPTTISYVETHGTGTPLGDPIEVAALHPGLSRRTRRARLLRDRLGEDQHRPPRRRAPASTGFIKTVLALQHRQLPPSLHFERPIPRSSSTTSPFFVNARAARPGRPARPAARRRQLVRHRRHQRARGARGSAGTFLGTVTGPSIGLLAGPVTNRAGRRRAAAGVVRPFARVARRDRPTTWPTGSTVTTPPRWPMPRSPCRTAAARSSIACARC